MKKGFLFVFIVGVLLFFISCTDPFPGPEPTPLYAIDGHYDITLSERATGEGTLTLNHFRDTLGTNEVVIFDAPDRGIDVNTKGFNELHYNLNNNRFDFSATSTFGGSVIESLHLTDFVVDKDSISGEITYYDGVEKKTFYCIGERQ